MVRSKAAANIAIASARCSATTSVRQRGSTRASIARLIRASYHLSQKKGPAPRLRPRRTLSADRGAPGSVREALMLIQKSMDHFGEIGNRLRLRQDSDPRVMLDAIRKR